MLCMDPLVLIEIPIIQYLYGIRSMRQIIKEIEVRVFEECYSHHLIDTKGIFIDSTRVKACANNKKAEKKLVHQGALFCEKQLEIEINADRRRHSSAFPL